MYAKFERCNTSDNGNYNCLEITDEGIRIDIESQRTFYPYGSFKKVEVFLGDFFVVLDGALPPRGVSRQYTPADAEERKQIKALVAEINERNANGWERTYITRNVDNSEAKARVLTSKNSNNNANAGGKNSGSGFIMKVILVIALVFVMGAFSQFGGCANSDIGYDEDGFLGYSDGFWEWMRKQ